MNITLEVEGKEISGSDFKKNVDRIRETLPFLWEDVDEVMSLGVGETMHSSGGFIKRTK